MLSSTSVQKGSTTISMGTNKIRPNHKHSQALINTRRSISHTHYQNASKNVCQPSHLTFLCISTSLLWGVTRWRRLSQSTSARLLNRDNLQWRSSRCWVPHSFGWWLSILSDNLSSPSQLGWWLADWRGMELWVGVWRPETQLGVNFLQFFFGFTHVFAFCGHFDCIHALLLSLESDTRFKVVIRFCKIFGWPWVLAWRCCVSQALAGMLEVFLAKKAVESNVR